MDRFFPGQKVVIIQSKLESLMNKEVTIASPKRLVKNAAHPEGVMKYRLKETGPAGLPLEASEDQLKSTYDGSAPSSWKAMKEAVGFVAKGAKVHE